MERGASKQQVEKELRGCFLGHEEILKMSRQTSVFDLKSSSGTLALSFVLLGSGDDDADDPPTVQYEVPPP